MKKQHLFSPFRQCFNTPVGFGKDFLANNDVTTLEIPQYSPDLFRTEFYLFFGFN
jgi:hypothetical protein